MNTDQRVNEKPQVNNCAQENDFNQQAMQENKYDINERSENEGNLNLEYIYTQYQPQIVSSSSYMQKRGSSFSLSEESNNNNNKKVLNNEGYIHNSIYQDKCLQYSPDKLASQISIEMNRGYNNGEQFNHHPSHERKRGSIYNLAENYYERVINFNQSTTEEKRKVIDRYCNRILSTANTTKSNSPMRNSQKSYFQFNQNPINNGKDTKIDDKDKLMSVLSPSYRQLHANNFVQVQPLQENYLRNSQGNSYYNNSSFEVDKMDESSASNYFITASPANRCFSKNSQNKNDPCIKVQLHLKDNCNTPQQELLMTPIITDYLHLTPSNLNEVNSSKQFNVQLPNQINLESCNSFTQTLQPTIKPQSLHLINQNNSNKITDVKFDFDKEQMNSYVNSSMNLLDEQNESKINGQFQTASQIELIHQIDEPDQNFIKVSLCSKMEGQLDNSQKGHQIQLHNTLSGIMNDSKMNGFPKSEMNVKPDCQITRLPQINLNQTIENSYLNNELVGITNQIINRSNETLMNENNQLKSLDYYVTNKFNKNNPQSDNAINEGQLNFSHEKQKRSNKALQINGNISQSNQDIQRKHNKMEMDDYRSIVKMQEKISQEQRQNQQFFQQDQVGDILLNGKQVQHINLNQRRAYLAKKHRKVKKVINTICIDLSDLTNTTRQENNSNSDKRVVNDDDDEDDEEQKKSILNNYFKENINNTTICDNKLQTFPIPSSISCWAESPVIIAERQQQQQKQSSIMESACYTKMSQTFQTQNQVQPWEYSEKDINQKGNYENDLIYVKEQQYNSRDQITQQLNAQKPDLRRSCHSQDDQIGALIQQTKLQNKQLEFKLLNMQNHVNRLKQQLPKQIQKQKIKMRQAIETHEHAEQKNMRLTNFNEERTLSKNVNLEDKKRRNSEMRKQQKETIRNISDKIRTDKQNIAQSVRRQSMTSDKVIQLHNQNYINNNISLNQSHQHHHNEIQQQKKLLSQNIKQDHLRSQSLKLKNIQMEQQSILNQIQDIKLLESQLLLHHQYFLDIQSYSQQIQ